MVKQMQFLHQKLKIQLKLKKNVMKKVDVRVLRVQIHIQKEITSLDLLRFYEKKL